MFDDQDRKPTEDPTPDDELMAIEELFDPEALNDLDLLLGADEATNTQKPQQDDSIETTAYAFGTDDDPEPSDDLMSELLPFPDDENLSDPRIKVVGIRFYPGVELELCEPGVFNVRVGDEVIVTMPDGSQNIGVVARSPYYVHDEEIDLVVGNRPLPIITEWAEDKDIVEQVAREQEALVALGVAREKVVEHGLDMKIISATFDDVEQKLTFEFTAEGRVDFRNLVKDLAAIFRRRIELRQVGVRDQAAKAGGIGPCGREFCCSTFLCEFRPVSIRMAKDQDLSMNPNNISGCCGRLLCCLRYEHEAYINAKKIMPRVGHTVTTIYGKGKIRSTNLLKGELQIELFDADPGDDPITIHLADLSGRDAVANVSKPKNFPDVAATLMGNGKRSRRDTDNQTQSYDFGDMGGASTEEVEDWEEQREKQDKNSGRRRGKQDDSSRRRQTKKRKSRSNKTEESARARSPRKKSEGDDGNRPKSRTRRTRKANARRPGRED